MMLEESFVEPGALVRTRPLSLPGDAGGTRSVSLLLMYAPAGIVTARESSANAVGFEDARLTRSGATSALA